MSRAADRPTRCVDGRLMRHDPQRDDPSLETDRGACPECNGRGCLPREDWEELGEAHRVLRVALRKSPADIGLRLGLSSRQITDMEHGREDPTPILEPLWAALNPVQEVSHG